MSDKNEISLEDLLIIASTPTKEKIKVHSDYSDAYQVLLAFEIEPGTEKVKASLLYEVYKKWKKKGKIHGKNKFFKDIKNYLERFTDGKDVQYLMNKTAHDLTDILRELDE